MNTSRLFVASCISLVTTSMVFAIRGDIEPAMSAAFQLTAQQMGLIWSPAFWAFTIAIFVSGALVDMVGMRALHILSAVGYLVGVALVLFAPYPSAPVASIFDTTGTTMLYVGRLHAWWPGGLIIGGLTAYAIFLLLFICMWMTAAVELGPDQWFPSVMSSLTGMQGILFLVYTAGLMFVLRTYCAGVAHGSPIGTLVVSSMLVAVGLYWLGSLQPGGSSLVALAAATILGIGKTYFWPTMLGVTAEQFPRGGALLLSLMGGAGMLSVAIVLPIMGARIDRLGAGAALRFIASLAVVLAVIFGGLYVYFPRVAATAR
jgi:hypothetical protein